MGSSVSLPEAACSSCRSLIQDLSNRLKVLFIKGDKLKSNEMEYEYQGLISNEFNMDYENDDDEEIILNSKPQPRNQKLTQNQPIQVAYDPLEQSAHQSYKSGANDDITQQQTNSISSSDYHTTSFNSGYRQANEADEVMAELTLLSDDDELLI